MIVPIRAVCHDDIESVWVSEFVMRLLLRQLLYKVYYLTECHTTQIGFGKNLLSA